MRRNTTYDIGNTDYTRSMNEKSKRYNNLVLKAERINHEQDGKPTKEEAQFYVEAAKVCEEIMNMNLSQRQVYEQWKYRQLDCVENARRIKDILMPPPPPAPKEEKTSEPLVQAIPNGKRAAAEKPVSKVSKSGFTSEHASKDVPLEMIEKWFKEAPDTGFEKVVGRTEEKKRLLDEAASLGWDKLDSALEISPVNCYFLYGPPGTGKTFLIKAFAGELKKRGFKFMHLKGSEIHASYVGVAEKIVTAAFNVAEEHAPCLIFIDEIDNLCVSRTGKSEGHEKRLTTAFLEAYNEFKASNKRLIFIGATNHPGLVDDAMMDRITLIKIPLPAEEDRKGYFDRLSLSLEEGLTSGFMAADTDNHSYRDLDRLKDAMLVKLKNQAIEKYRILDENGNLDQAATDEKASQAILNGEFVLTRAIFEETRKENPPQDKTKSREELKAFEEHVAAIST